MSRPQAHVAHPQAQRDQTGSRRKLDLFIHRDGSSRRSVSSHRYSFAEEAARVRRRPEQALFVA
jgi:hypothetical protein